MQAALPIRGHAPSGSRSGLIQGMVLRLGELRPFIELLGLVTPEPVFAGLEAADDWMPGLGSVVARMLRRR